jgi:hypothetical protein
MKGRALTETRATPYQRRRGSGAAAPMFALLTGTAADAFPLRAQA